MAKVNLEVNATNKASPALREMQRDVEALGRSFGLTADQAKELSKTAISASKANGQFTAGAVRSGNATRAMAHSMVQGIQAIEKFNHDLKDTSLTQEQFSRKTMISFMQVGSSIGSAFGPAGQLVGAAAGAIIGHLSSISPAIREMRNELIQLENFSIQQEKLNQKLRGMVNAERTIKREQEADVATIEEAYAKMTKARSDLNAEEYMAWYRIHKQKLADLEALTKKAQQEAEKQRQAEQKRQEKGLEGLLDIRAQMGAQGLQVPGLEKAINNMTNALEKNTSEQEMINGESQGLTLL